MLVGATAGLGTAACGAMATGPAQRCTSGDYTDSAQHCRALATTAPSSEEAKRLRLRAARLDLWQCADVDNAACPSALVDLWQLSTDPDEVKLAAGLARAVCARHGRPACDVISAAAWFGRGAEADAVVSLGTSFTSPYFAPPTFDEPWAKLTSEDLYARASALVDAGAYRAASHLATSSVASGAMSPAQGAEVVARSDAAWWAKEVEARIAKGRALDALAAADALAGEASTLRRPPRSVAPASSSRPTLAAIARARTAGLPMSARLHAAIAAGLGATVTVPPAPQVEGQDVRLRATVTGITDPSCGFLKSLVDGGYPAAGANVTVTARLTCVDDLQTEQYDRPDVEKKQVEREELVHDGEECHYVRSEACYGFNGVNCRAEVCAPKFKRVKITETRAGKITMRKAERHRSKVAVKGTLSTPFGTAQVAYERATNDRGGDSRHEAFAKVREGIERLLVGAVDARIERELAKGQGASGPALEEAQLRAIALGHSPVPLAGVLGLEPSQLLDAWKAGALKLAEIRLDHDARPYVDSGTTTLDPQRHPKPSRN